MTYLNTKDNNNDETINYNDSITVLNLKRRRDENC